MDRDNPTVTPSIEETLRGQFGEQLQRNVVMAPFTSIKIGGPADFFIEARTPDDLIFAFRLTQELDIPFHFFGGCSNVVIADAGLRGLVVINKIEHIEWQDDFKDLVGGGYNLDQFVAEVSRRGWADLTFSAGIPGSVGGALVGGAGAFGHLVHEFLDEARVLQRDGAVKKMTIDELGIEYRTSAAKKRGDIILEALMGPFTPGNVSELLAEIANIKQQREGKHPGPNLPSAGSFFKNLPPKNPGEWRTPAGKLLDEVNAKELRIGDAGVFEKHANIIVNYGNAKAADVDALANIMAERVKEKFGIELEREVQLLK